ncbi:hypothetical protein [Janthinobacterium sp.]|uniref:hypothetical protein n=1 Tax=Janthinobacterium sp. TaxID=1871054 RepID=UPI0028983313|nr:hypothetical protein [Janthinobacterium sp.]
MTTLSGLKEINMKVYQSAALALMAWAAAIPAGVAGTTEKARGSHAGIVIGDDVAADDARPWNRQQLPSARVPASGPVPAQQWSPAIDPRRGAGRSLPAAQVQPARAITPVPETNMYSMLLVGLGLLALHGSRTRQEKFEQ